MLNNLLEKILKPLYGTGIGQYYPFKWGYSLYIYYLIRKYEGKITEVSTQKTQFKMKIHPSMNGLDKNLIINNQHEPKITKFIEDNLNPTSTFVDAGANTGYYTLLSSCLIGPTGSVESFEPVTKTFEILQRNCELNNVTNVTMHRVGFSSSRGSTEMHINESNLTYTSSEKNENTRHGNVEMVELQALDETSIEPDFIKIDVEGHELQVLKGAKTTIKEAEPIILFEFTPSFIKDKEDAQATLNFLQEYYTVRVLGHRERITHISDIWSCNQKTLICEPQ